MIHFQTSLHPDCQAFVVFVTDQQWQQKNHPAITQLGLDGVGLERLKAFTAQHGQLFPYYVENNRLIVFVGVGDVSDMTATELRILVKNAYRSTFLSSYSTVTMCPFDDDPSQIVAMIEGVMIGGYKWTKYIHSDEKESTDQQATTDKQVYLCCEPNPLYDATLVVAQGTNKARDLVNENADVATSAFFEQTIMGIVAKHDNVKLRVLNREELKDHGLNLHLAVNQGSHNEPKLIVVEYNGASDDVAPVAIVGKGMTFDTGGLNLKPTGNIESMKLDMGGAAAVVGTLYSVLNLGININALFVCGMAENAIGAASYKPGDVITGFAGKSVEVANTDAEGRLVLADAISFVKAQYQPRYIVDIATLTGACMIALGWDHTGLMTNDEQLAEWLLHSGAETDDRVWRLPLYKELRGAVKSKIADIRNLGYPKGVAGTITAAEFLHQFSAGVPWAHLDIAGTSYVDGQERWYFDHGGTGAGVRLLTRLLDKMSSADGV